MPACLNIFTRSVHSLPTVPSLAAIDLSLNSIHIPPTVERMDRIDKELVMYM
jgi:hypothetical protein